MIGVPAGAAAGDGVAVVAVPAEDQEAVAAGRLAVVAVVVEVTAEVAVVLATPTATTGAATEMPHQKIIHRLAKISPVKDA